jgi:hypothetical protein
LDSPTTVARACYTASLLDTVDSVAYLNLGCSIQAAPKTNHSVRRAQIITSKTRQVQSAHTGFSYIPDALPPTGDTSRTGVQRRLQRPMRAEYLRANGISQCEGIGKPEQQFPCWIPRHIGDTGTWSIYIGLNMFG